MDLPENEKYNRFFRLTVGRWGQRWEGPSGRMGWREGMQGEMAEMGDIWEVVWKPTVVEISWNL